MIKIKNLIKVNAYIMGFMSLLSVCFDIKTSMAFVASFLFLLAIVKEIYLNFNIPRFILNIVAITIIFLLFFNISMETAVYSIIYSLLLLLIIKYFGDKNQRDYLQIIVIAFFILSGSALINFSIRFILITIVLFMLATFELLFLAFHKNNYDAPLTKEELITIIKKMILLPGITLPIASIIFLVMPRTGYPLFDFLNKKSEAVSGFVESIKLGSTNAIYEDSSIAFRVNMPETSDKNLYWRGITLNKFDGKNWTYEKIINPSKETFPARNKNISIKQEIYLNPTGSKYFISMDKPFKLFFNRKLNFQTEFNIKTEYNIDKSVHYTAYSIPTSYANQYEINVESYTQLPSINTKILKLADRLNKFDIYDHKTSFRTLSGFDNRKIINNTLQYLLGGNFTYTLKNLPQSSDPLSEFLFITKKGNCELFASAFAVILRANNIPVRLVSGYKGGIYNKIFGYYFIPYKNAHIWAEVWQEGKWTRVDPSPSSIDYLINKDDFLKKIKIFTDSIDYYWSIFVINYDFQKQITLFSYLSNPIFLEKKALFKILIIIFILTSVIVLMITNRRLKNKNNIIIGRERSLKIIKKFEKKLFKYGFSRNKGETLTKFINRNSFGNKTKQQLTIFVTYVMSYFYRDKDIPLKLYDDLTKQLKMINKSTLMK